MAENECEIWKDIPGYEGLYKISSIGRIKALRKLITRNSTLGKIFSYYVSEKFLKPGISKSGYPHINLCKDGEIKQFYIHQLVLLAFVGPCPPGHEVRHFPDKDPLNVKLNNIQYGTPKENNQDKIIHGTSCRGSLRPNSKLTEDQVLQILIELKRGKSPNRISKKYHVNGAAIRNIRLGYNWSWLTGIKPNIVQEQPI